MLQQRNETLREKTTSKKRAQGSATSGEPHKASQIDKEWFAARQRELNIKSLAQVGRELGIDKAMLTRSLQGARIFTAKDVVGLARVFKASFEEIFRRIGYEVPKPGVPILGVVRTDGKVATVGPHKDKLFEMPEPPVGAQALVFTGGTHSAMSCYEGATFVVAPTVGDSRAPVITPGQFCYVEADGHLTALFGTIVKGSRGVILLELFGCDERVELQKVHKLMPVVAIIFA